MSEIGLSHLRITVVEDNEDGRVLLTSFLRSSGARVDAYASAAEALKAIRQAKPDILISDIMMPDHDGYWLINQVRQLQPGEGRDIPAIALTGKTGEKEHLRALEAGYQMYIPKPPMADHLIAAIKYVATLQMSVTSETDPLTLRAESTSSGF
jgi:two-component system, OmpR family, response regulator